MHRATLLKTFALLGIVLFAYGNCHAQRYLRPQDRRFEIDFGLGFPDLLHTGMKYKLTPINKVGMSYGMLIPSEKNNRRTHAVTFEHEYHFGKISEKSITPLYYFAQKATYLHDSNGDVAVRTVYLTPSIGKSFYGDGLFGIHIDVGLNVKIAEDRIATRLGDTRGITSFPNIFPAVRFQFFFHL